MMRRAAGFASPLLDRSLGLFARAEALGQGGADMAAVVLAFSELGPQGVGCQKNNRRHHR